MRKLKPIVAATPEDLAGALGLSAVVRCPGINWTGRVLRFRPKSALIGVYRRLVNCF